MGKKNKLSYSVITEDDNWLIINKSAGILTVPDRYDQDIPNLKSLLNQRYGNIWVVHRLDRETSGVMVFAKDEESHKALNQQFQDRTVAKKYWALVKGTPNVENDRIISEIVPHSVIKGKMRVVKRDIKKQGMPPKLSQKDGKPIKSKIAISNYRTLEKFKLFSLLEVSIETGRTHQIRVHLPSVGLPLAVDFLYGTENGLKLSDFKRKYRENRGNEERPLLNRTSLHAHTLVLKHPKTGEDCTFEAELPKDFAVTLKQLRKYGA